MTIERPSPHRLAVFGAVLAIASVPASAGAQDCATDRPEPVVCDVELLVFQPGDRRGERLGGNTLRLDTRAGVEVAAEASDQYGRRFPADRFQYFLDLGRDCDGLVSAEETADGAVHLETEATTGDCEALLWLPNDLNHDREIRIVVERPERRGYSREEAELLATWLYRAVLGREPEPGGFQSATAEIQKGELGALVRAIVRSPEFQRRRSEVTAPALLESFYQGLFGREPDSGAVRTYLRRVERGDYADVLWTLLQSDELEERLDRSLANGG